MKVVLATGIYPPDIGGPATYVHSLAQELTAQGVDIVVVTYAEHRKQKTEENEAWPVIRVAKSGGPFLRWRRYSAALRKHAADTDVVYAFSSVSVGVPVRLARLTQPRKVLRLGGDFLWERYTDRGGALGLRAWYEQGKAPQSLAQFLLRGFQHIVFSTELQRDLYQQHYTQLPAHTVIENATPIAEPIKHTRHTPLRLLSFGRLVRFKNLPVLIEALTHLPEAQLSIVGEGPEQNHLQSLVERFNLHGRVIFIDAVPAKERPFMFQQHDLLVIPSLTEISPNAALEARAAGLPVLLTKETGLSTALTNGMIVRDLQTPDQIATAITEVTERYEAHATAAAESATSHRDWSRVAQEHVELFGGIR